MTESMKAKLNHIEKPKHLQMFVWFCCLMVGHLCTAASTVEQITTVSAQPPFTARHHQLHQLGVKELNAGAGALITFMRAERVPEGMDPVEYMSLVNDSFNLLVKNGIQVQQLFELILQVVPDESAGVVWRDYCVQKLGYTLDRNDISLQGLTAGLKLLDRLTLGDYPPMQGTALIVANQLASHPILSSTDFLNQRSIGERALSCAIDPAKPLIDRMTALQVAGMCDAPGTLNCAVSLLTAGEDVQIMLKVAAMATIGQTGSVAEIPLLADYRKSPDVRLRKAARSAMKQLQGDI